MKVSVSYHRISVHLFISFAFSCSLVSCGTAPRGGEAVDLKAAKTPQELAAILESIAPRNDAEACAAKARILARLREMEGGDAPILLARGDAADIDLLSRASTEELKAESAERLSRHFLERARRPAGAGSTFPGPYALLLRRFVLLTVGSSFAEYAPRDLKAGSLEELARASEALATAEGMKPGIRKEWESRAKACSIGAAVVRAAEEKGDVTAEARRFCEAGLGRHLDEATRAADRATTERAARGDPGRILDSCLIALAHYAVARECLVTPTPAQEHALSGMEIVMHSLCDLLAREP